MRGPELSEYEAVQRRIAEREAQYAKELEGGRMPFYQQAEADARQMGIGKATEEGRAMVAEKEAELPKEERRGKWLAAAEAFFGMAEAGGESGSTFWGAAGKGGSKGVAAYNKLLNDLDAKEERLDAQKLQLAQMEEAQKLGYMQAGDARYSRKEAQVEAAQAQKDAVLLKVADVRNEFALRKMQVEAQVAIAEIQAGNDSKAKKVLNEFTEYYNAAVRAGDKDAQTYFAGHIETLTKALSGSFLAAQYKLENGPLAGMVPGGAAAPADGGGVEFIGSRPDR